MWLNYNRKKLFQVIFKTHADFVSLVEYVLKKIELKKKFLAVFSDHVVGGIVGIFILRLLNVYCVDKESSSVYIIEKWDLGIGESTKDV